jgi:hypothetical protein
MNNIAIVALAIGEQHLAYWRKYCQASWRAYAQKCGYDLILVTEPFDDSSRAAARSPAWQKCLVLSQEFSAKFRQIVLLDTDILINTSAAPPITDQTPEEWVGGVISGSHIQDDLRLLLLSRLKQDRIDYEPGLGHWRDDQAAYYRHFGLSPIDAGIIQTGVLVASPHHHRQIFESAYQTLVASQLRSYEQIPLSHAILTSGAFRQIDTRFNSVFYETMLVHYAYLSNTQTPSYGLLATAAVQAQYFNSFFLHFAHAPDFIRFLPWDELSHSDT